MSQILPNHKTKTYGGAWCIMDSAVCKTIDSFLHNLTLDQILEKNANIFCQDYFSWIKNSNNDLNGIDNFQSLSFSLGTTNAFDMFTLNHKNKQLVSFAGEYVYHNIIQRSQQGWVTIINDPDDLQKNHALIISAPFADTGMIHNDFENILTKCDLLKIPVLVDCAYLNICRGIKIDFNHPCIDSITTSLSKVFPLSQMRIGMRMRKNNQDDGLDMLTENNYVNLIGVAIGHHLIKEYDPNYIVNKYAKQQHDFCEKLQVTPSHSVIFGIDYNKKYDDYNRGSSSNRLCFAKHYTS